MFKFKIHQANEIIDEEFFSAVECSKSCIESVLSDLNAKIAVDRNIISIIIIGITEKECMDKIKGCFCDRDGNIYQEFNNIELLTKNI